MFPSSDYYIYYACVKNGVILLPKKLYPEYITTKEYHHNSAPFQNKLIRSNYLKRLGTVEGDSKVVNQHTELEQNP